MRRAHRQAALCAIMAGRLDKVAAGFQIALDLAPNAGLSHAFLAIRDLQGRSDEGLALAKLELHDVFRDTALAMIHHTLTDRAASDAALQTLITESSWTAAVQIAEVYAYRNEIDNAFEWLERAYTQRDPGLVFTGLDKLLHLMYGDPRWKPFLHKMGLA